MGCFFSRPRFEFEIPDESSKKWLNTFNELIKQLNDLQKDNFKGSYISHYRERLEIKKRAINYFPPNDHTPTKWSTNGLSSILQQERDLLLESTKDFTPEYPDNKKQAIIDIALNMFVAVCYIKFASNVMLIDFHSSNTKGLASDFIQGRFGNHKGLLDTLCNIVRNVQENFSKIQSNDQVITLIRNSVALWTRQMEEAISPVADLETRLLPKSMLNNSINNSEDEPLLKKSSGSSCLPF